MLHHYYDLSRMHIADMHSARERQRLADEVRRERQNSGSGGLVGWLRQLSAPKPRTAVVPDAPCTITPERRAEIIRQEWEVPTPTEHKE